MKKTKFKINSVDDIKGSPKIPTDRFLIELLKKAYTQNFKCYKAVILMSAIQPFSDFVPEITRKDLDKFVQNEKDGAIAYLFVYRKKDKFIMSDDYKVYYCYKLLGINEVPCIVLGDPKGKSVLFKGKPFLLPPPIIKVEND